MLNNIRHHSLVVAQLADQLLNGLADNTTQLPLPERNLVVAGALLHDIAKTPCLNGSCDHAAVGAEICLQHGYPEVAEIVGEHVILQDYAPTRYATGHFTAREIVYYADKRVRHNHIVHLDDRLEYILDHYGKGDPDRHSLIRKNFEKCLELERYLFTFIPFPPEAL